MPDLTPKSSQACSPSITLGSDSAACRYFHGLEWPFYLLVAGGATGRRVGGVPVLIQSKTQVALAAVLLSMVVLSGPVYSQVPEPLAGCIDNEDVSCLPGPVPEIVDDCNDVGLS